MLIIHHYLSSRWSVLLSHLYADTQTFLTSCYTADLPEKAFILLWTNLCCGWRCKHAGNSMLSLCVSLFILHQSTLPTIPMNSKLLHKHHAFAFCFIKNRESIILLYCWQGWSINNTTKGTLLHLVMWFLRECSGNIRHIVSFFMRLQLTLMIIQLTNLLKAHSYRSIGFKFCLHNNYVF